MTQLNYDFYDQVNALVVRRDSIQMNGVMDRRVPRHYRADLHGQTAMQLKDKKKKTTSDIHQTSNCTNLKIICGIQ